VCRVLLLQIVNLQNKKIVVTGATGGIGSEIAKKLAAAGAKLVLIARTEDKLKKLLTELQGEGHIYYEADFTQKGKLESLGNELKGRLGAVDVLINAAGIGVYKNIEDVSPEEWDSSFMINVTAPYFLSKHLMPLLKKQEKSLIINIGSGMGKIPTAGRSVYCATKFALRGMTLSLAEEFEGTDVNFVHIALGSTLTEFGPMSLSEKEEENLKGKSYLTPGWVAKRFLEIIESGQYSSEIEIYPTDYKE